MRARNVTALALLVTGLATTQARADQGHLVVESDTGIVFGDLECEIQSAQAGTPRFAVDEFDYLSATVEVTTTCVTEDGTQWTQADEDTVAFTQLTFDWAKQAWFIGDKKIADRVDGYQVQLNPDFEYPVWTDVQPESVSFKVEVREHSVP